MAGLAVRWSPASNRNMEGAMAIEGATAGADDIIICRDVHK